jgi:tetratricopeptide (TPR) repeat protein
LQFDKGRALMKEKKYAEACAAFEQSQKLDPQLGTLYNLGICYAELGKIASAWTAYREVGQRDANAGRKKEANRRAKELEKRLPKLLVTIAAAPPGLAVTLNGADVTALVGADSPVDPAEYKVKATAPGHAPWEATVKLAEGKTTTLAIELRPAAKDPGRSVAAARPPSPGGAAPDGAAPDGAAVGAAADRPPSRTGSSTRKKLGLVLGIGGSVSVAAGVVSGVLARSKWNEARALCGGDAICDDPATLAQGNALVDDARLRADLSTGLVLGGAVLLGAGAVLWLTAPKAPAASDTALRLTPRLTPQIGPGHAGLTLGGQFP